MSELPLDQDDFNARAAALEEHLVHPTSADHLDEAERFYAAGKYDVAKQHLVLARHQRHLEQQRDELSRQLRADH